MELVGRVISHYQFLEKLGAGGMGDIYRAHDARLNRFVAVKVLSSANAGDPERRRRFIQEAQAASGLNHPNIITIHDIVNEPEGDYMVMEYVSGKTLVDLIPKGGLRPPQALKYGVQMADALSAAHAAGIVHRDLKPGNVMVTDSGLVKVLDFGLAKLTDRGPASNIGDNTQTIAEAPLTVEGSIIGTVSYMSPEQAQGKKVDTRSDIFSFGVVFYEMLTGTRAFSGDSALSTLSAILRDEHKPMVQIAPDVPPQLELLITRCLRKNPDERWQSMKDVLAALGALKHESDSGQLYRSRIQAVEMRPQAPVPVPKKSSAPLLAGIGALVLLLGGGAAGGWWWMKHHNVAPPAPIVVEVPVPAAPAVVPAPVEAPPAEAVMNNDNIIELVTEKVPVSVILSQIRAASKTDFVLTSAEVIRLSKAHVPGPVIEAMRDPKRIPVQPADATNAANNTKKTQAVAAAKQTVAPAPAPVTPPVSQPQNTAKATTASPVPVPAPAKPAAPAAVPVSVGDGMPFSIKLAEDVPTDAEEGRILRFTVVDGLKVGDNVVIAKGAAVTGSILEAAKKKAFGIGGKMQFRLLQVDAVDGKKINVRAEPSRGKDGPAKRPIDSGAKGKTKEIAAAAGSQYVGYIEGDQTVSVRK